MNDLSAFLSLYRWGILAGVAMSVVLSTLGIHLASRDRAVQTVCVSQGAMLGVLVALGILGTNDAEGLEGIVPVLAASLGAAGAYYGTLLGARYRSSENTYFAAMFGFLLALGVLVTAFFPRLESHATHVYFGDLATLSDEDAKFCLCLSLAIAAWLWLNRRRNLRQSFELSVFGGSFSSTWTFDLISLVAIGFSVQYLGFLFTISMLFLPTVIAARSRRVGGQFHFWLVLTMAVGGSALGFVLSLANTRLATVPTIVVGTFLLGSVAILLTRARRPC